MTNIFMCRFDVGKWRNTTGPFLSRATQAERFEALLCNQDIPDSNPAKDDKVITYL